MTDPTIHLSGRVPVVGARPGAPNAPVAPGVNTGDVLYWNGVLWTPLAPDVDGRQLTTHGIGLPPTWEAGTVAPVTSVFGRIGAVAAALGDYSFPLIAGTIDDVQHGARGGGALHALVTALDSGFMSPADFVKLAGIGAAAGVPILSWGNNNVGITTTTRYMEPWFDDTLSPTSPTQFRVRRPGTLTNARVIQNVAAGNGNAIVYTLRVNGIATALSISVASTTVDSVVDPSTVAVAAEDLVDIEVTKALGIGTSPTNCLFMCEYQGT